MVKSRWEKKKKSTYKVLNRKKRIGYTNSWRISPCWADTGCVCSCSQCSHKHSWYYKSDLRKQREEKYKLIGEYYVEHERSTNFNSD